jgi:hypothetical protein
MIDPQMLSVIKAGGDSETYSQLTGVKMTYPSKVTLISSMDARSKPDYSGNKVGMYSSGVEYNVYGESDLCYKLSSAQNHWMLKSNCKSADVPDDEVPIPPVHTYPPSVKLTLPDGNGGDQPPVIYDRRA